jgi:OPA family glycerol-3-phosphate transporter-like MFS transporter
MAGVALNYDNWREQLIYPALWHVFTGSLLNPRYERWRRLTFGITWLVYASYYFTRQSFSVAKVALENDPTVALSRQQLGLVDSTFLATYSVGQFIFGPLADRFGSRVILLVGMALSALAAVGSGFSKTAIAFIMFAVVQGIAQSTGWTANSKVMSAWFSLRERGRVLGWWCTHYTVGAALASPFAAWLMDAYGRTAIVGGATTIVPFWPAAFWGPAAVLAVVMLIMWAVLRNRPEDVGLPPIEQYHHEPESLIDESERIEAAPEGSWKVIREVLASPNIWLLAIAYFPVKLARYSFYFWGPKYVEESLGTAAFSSAMTAAWMPIGGMVGVVVSGYISDKLFQARRAPIIILSLLAAAAVMLLGQMHIHNLWLMRAFFFFIGVFLYGPDSMLSATAAIDFGTKRGAGAATGFINGIGSFGAVLGGYLPGVMTTKSDWTVFFQISLAGLIVSAAVLVPLWRRRPPTA